MCASFLLSISHTPKPKRVDNSERSLESSRFEQSSLVLRDGIEDSSVINLNYHNNIITVHSLSDYLSVGAICLPEPFVSGE